MVGRCPSPAKVARRLAWHPDAATVIYFDSETGVEQIVLVDLQLCSDHEWQAKVANRTIDPLSGLRGSKAVRCLALRYRRA